VASRLIVIPRTGNKAVSGLPERRQPKVDLE
jgi:hypothetical protein